MDVTVFYAWQSDTAASINHNFIFEAATAACERITADMQNDWQVKLDHDTNGIYGMCDIPLEILRKIRRCDIFLGDLTLVGKTKKSKQLPNSNVVFELGYAAGRKGFGRLIAVVNEEFGKIKGQVFDIKRRASLRYRISESAPPQDLLRVKAELSSELEGAIRGIIRTRIAPQLSDAEEKSRDKDAESHGLFCKQVLEGRFYGGYKLPAMLHSIRFVWPKGLAFDAVMESIEVYNSNVAINAGRVAWNDDTLSIMELLHEGVLRRASINDVTSSENAARMNGGDPRVFRADTMQWYLVSRAIKDCKFLMQFGIKPPFIVRASLVGAKGYIVTENQLGAGRKCESDEITMPPVRIASVDELKGLEENAGPFKDSLNNFSQHFGWPRSPAILPDGTWAVRFRVM